MANKRNREINEINNNNIDNNIENNNFSYILTNSINIRVENALNNAKNKQNEIINKNNNKNDKNNKKNQKKKEKKEKKNQISNNNNKNNNKNENENIQLNKKRKIEKKEKNKSEIIQSQEYNLLNIIQTIENIDSNSNSHVPSGINDINTEFENIEKITTTQTTDIISSQLEIPLPSPSLNNLQYIELKKHPFRSISFSFNETNQIGSLVFLDESQVLHISGMCTLRLICGKGNINGYTLKLNEEITIKMPSWMPAVRLFIEPTSNIQDKNIFQQFFKSKSYYEKHGKDIENYLNSSKIIFEIISINMFKESWMIRCEDFNKYQLLQNLTSTSSLPSLSSPPSIILLSTAVIGLSHDLSTLGINSQVLPSNWISAGDIICKSIKSSPHIILCGAKGVGKSTTLRYMLNRIISKTSYVAVIDCDIGQPEFTTPGLVSLHIFSKKTTLLEQTFQLPILSAPHLHLNQPQLSYFLGDASVKDLPELFEKCIEKLYNQYLLYCEYYSIVGNIPILSNDEFLTENMIEDAKKSYSFNLLHENPYEEYPLPLIINTDGMVRGMGIEIQKFIFDIMKPTHILHLQSEKDKELASIEDLKLNDHENKLKICLLTPGRNTPSPISSQDLRDIRIISYFLFNNSYLNQLTQPTIDSIEQQIEQEKDDDMEQIKSENIVSPISNLQSKLDSDLNQSFRYPIFIRNAVCIDHSGILPIALMTSIETSIPFSKILFNLIENIIPSRLLLAAFNLSLVGISSFDSFISLSSFSNIQTVQLQLPPELLSHMNQPLSYSPPSSLNYNQPMTIQYTTNDSISHLLPCQGLGIISEIKLFDKIIQLMTPTDLNTSNNSNLYCFSKGAIQIPSCLLFSVGGQLSTPYLCSENFGEGSASLSTRSNIKRRSHVQK